MILTTRAREGTLKAHAHVNLLSRGRGFGACLNMDPIKTGSASGISLFLLGPCTPTANSRGTCSSAGTRATAAGMDLRVRACICMLGDVLVWLRCRSLSGGGSGTQQIWCCPDNLATVLLWYALCFGMLSKFLFCPFQPANSCKSCTFTALTYLTGNKHLAPSSGQKSQSSLLFYCPKVKFRFIAFLRISSDKLFIFYGVFHCLSWHEL